VHALRRSARFDRSTAELLPVEAVDPFECGQSAVEDDRLRLIFTCCHPALPADARIALTLREVCGLTTEQIVRAFLTTVPAIAKRIVRSKAKIRDARIPRLSASRQG
jgi:RNA polymerase sigma-70 factor (ECF subfamily)